MKQKVRIGMGLFFLLFWPMVSSQGVERMEDPNESMVREIAKELRCAVCQNQSIYESNSDLAKDMLAIIREKVQAGENAATIRDYFFQRYGDYIYLEPTTNGVNWILWMGPFLGLLIGGVALGSAINRWRKTKSGTEDSEKTKPSSDTNVDSILQQRIQKELDQIQL